VDADNVDRDIDSSDFTVGDDVRETQAVQHQHFQLSSWEGDSRGSQRRGVEFQSEGAGSGLLRWTRLYECSPNETSVGESVQKCPGCPHPPISPTPVVSRFLLLLTASGSDVLNSVLESCSDIPRDASREPVSQPTLPYFVPLPARQNAGDE
jgi:hypothetical protein